MRKVFWLTVVAGGAATVLVVRARHCESQRQRERALLRHAADLARHGSGRLQGIAYRMSGRRPDPDIDHNGLADPHPVDPGAVGGPPRPAARPCDGDRPRGPAPRRRRHRR